MQRKKGQLICCMQAKALLSFYNVGTVVAIGIAIKTAINFEVNATIDVAINVGIKIVMKIAFNFRKHYKSEAQPF